MKTVPSNVQMVTQDQAVDVSGLPQEVSLALADIAIAARERLLAMSVAAGMAVIAAMFEAEVSAVTGPKGRRIPERVAVRNGTGKGSVTLGGGRVEVSRPRAERTTTTSRPRDSNDQDTPLKCEESSSVAARGPSWGPVRRATPWRTCVTC